MLLWTARRPYVTGGSTLEGHYFVPVFHRRTENVAVLFVNFPPVWCLAWSSVCAGAVWTSSRRAGGALAGLAESHPGAENGLVLLQLWSVVGLLLLLVV